MKLHFDITMNDLTNEFDYHFLNRTHSINCSFTQNLELACHT